MRYLCLIYHDDGTLDALPASEHDALARDALDYRDVLRQGGHYIDSFLLQGVDTATTVRVRNGKVHISDGPVAETKEQMGGFYLIDARDLNEAIRLASRLPPARLGSIEVRPVSEIERERFAREGAGARKS